MQPKKCSLNKATFRSTTLHQCHTLSLMLFTLSFYFVSFAEGSATVRYVSHTGSSIPPYTSWETAADSIQKCINISVFGDTIYVANGTYEEKIIMIRGLSLIGSGMDSCVIDTRNIVTTSFHAVEVVDSCLFKGFHVIVSYNTDMGDGIAGGGNSLITMNKASNALNGILVGSSPMVYKNITINNIVGISAISSSSIVRKNVVYTNDPICDGIQISAFTNTTPLIDSNYIETTEGGRGIAKSIGSNPTIKNNTIKLRGGSGITLSLSDSAKVFNNLIISEYASDGIRVGGTQYVKIYSNYLTGFYYYDVLGVGSYDDVKNNVVVNAEGDISLCYGCSEMIFQYNNIWNSEITYIHFTPDSTNLTVDPMVLNNNATQGDLDFHLQAYSPMIDAGDPTIFDRDGSRSDIGLYGGPYGESYTYQDLAPKPPRGLLAEVADSIITLTWKRNTEADFSYYNLYRDTTSNFQIDSTKLVSVLTDTIYQQTIPVGVESLYYKLTGVDNQGNVSNPSEEVAIIIVSIENKWEPVNNFILYQNYPNPFNPTTRIGYKLKERGYVKLYVYDVKGELVSVLVNEVQEAGYYEVEFNGDGKTELIKVKNPFVSGVYLCQIIIQSEKGIPVFSNIKKMILLK
ncbi:MAG: right-handed parallel beta-helix repeat-containing protein [bacterium]|nr:right-handed parallel beta-helix repeat-containing protein [bacterium]